MLSVRQRNMMRVASSTFRHRGTSCLAVQPARQIGAGLATRMTLGPPQGNRNIRPLQLGPNGAFSTRTSPSEVGGMSSVNMVLPDPRPPVSRDVGINVGRWVQEHYTAYTGDAAFLAGPTKRTSTLWSKVESLLHEEVKKGILGVETRVASDLTAFPPGYIDKSLEKVVGLQTDAPLKRAIKPLGGIRTVQAALEAYGYKSDPTIDMLYTKVRKTHNQGVFDAYTTEMKVARKAGILTGLPDGYGRGRLIGDYRRVALYGVDALIQAKRTDLEYNLVGVMDEETIRLREEVHDQIKALQDLKLMASSYGFDISRPANDAREAVQWLYFAYLGAVKEQDGAAMSLGRVDAFLDVFIERDLRNGTLNEQEAQELIDDFVIKLRLVRHLRTPEYNELFAGDPTWVTAVLGGTDAQGLPMVTKTSFRLLNTLYNLGPAPEPNLTVLWNQNLPEGFKRFCAGVSMDTSSIQYEGDKVMSCLFGSDYGVACCVSGMRLGQDMQYFGARCNLPKLLLYTLNQGRDELSAAQVGPSFPPLSDPNAPLDYEDVKARFENGMDWLAKLYADTMNVIHFMHDKYDYEKTQMALHDTFVRRFLSFGISGLSVVADSLSAIKHARVTPIRNEHGITVDFKVEGDFPKFGNDDDRVDSIAQWVAESFNARLQRQTTYRGSLPTLSVLTITSNVVYGRKTGATPDGRKQGEPFAPGANPLHGRDCTGALASLNSVAKIPYTSCLDGVSNTFSLVPQVLGKGSTDVRASNLAALLDGYFEKGGQHLNVNVLNRETLLDAVEHPERYPNLTIRVSGYAVHFHRLTRDQQLEVIARTFHDSY